MQKYAKIQHYRGKHQQTKDQGLSPSRPVAMVYTTVLKTSVLQQRSPTSQKDSLTLDVRLILSLCLWCLWDRLGNVACRMFAKMKC